MNITEQFDACFQESKMSGGMLRNVVIFGSKKSSNNRLYSDTAIDNLVEKSNGLKMYLNHPTKTELKEREGVRDIRDWGGVFSSPYRKGDKVIANLSVREEHKSLINDILQLSPANVGMSINARVKVSHNAENMEVVESVETLRSADLVMNAATTQSLFEQHVQESIRDKTIEESKDDFIGKSRSEEIEEAKEDFIEDTRR